MSLFIRMLYNSSMDSSGTRKTPILHLATIWKVLVPTALLSIINLLQVTPNDFWWHMRIGQVIVTEGYIPNVDIFSFTHAGTPWINQPWLMQVWFHLVYQAGGLALILFTHALIITAAYVILQRSLVRIYGLRPGVLAALVAALLGAKSWSVRPQSISFLMFALLMVLIESHRQGHHRRLWWVLAVFLVWVNGHGIFVFGIAALGLYILGQLWEFSRAGFPEGERRQHVELALIGLLSVGVLAANPQGFTGMVRYLFNFATSEISLFYNPEYARISLLQPDGIFLAVVVVALLVLVFRFGYRPTPTQWLMVVIFAGLAFFARRNLVWFGFVLAPVLGGGISHVWKDTEVRYAGIPRLNGIVLGMFAFLVLFLLPWWRSVLPFEDDRKSLETPETPIEATAFLCEHLPSDARVYQDYSFGGYQVWGCPELPVFIDSRDLFYPVPFWREYFDIQDADDGWEEMLETYGVTHLFLKLSSQQDLVEATGSSPEWVEIYRDDRAVIFEGVP